ncbi:MAG: TPM domain-containing protein [Cyclobacteriaceae bacterium]
MAKELFSDVEGRAIVDAIKEAERATSGEIRLHVENKCKGDVLDRAAEVFSLLNMHKTKLRNGVLFYLAVEDHKFAIIGDAGINQKVEDHYWGDIKEHMMARFKADAIVLGLCEGIKMTGQTLKEHFPALVDDKNEITDEISYGNN